MSNNFTLHMGFNGAGDVLIFAVAVRRNDGEHITDAQKDAAMNAAKSVLQICGAEVVANSTGVLVAQDVDETALVILDAQGAIDVQDTEIDAEGEGDESAEN